MNSTVIDRGSFSITGNTMNISGITITLHNISTCKVIKCPKHSMFSGLKEWIIILIILIIICNIWKNLMIIGDLYIYNIIEFFKTYYELQLQVGVD